jgi:hypothetical protein
MPGPTFQEVIQTLNRYWAEQGCILIQPLDTEVGAGTFHPATFLRAIGPEPWAAAPGLRDKAAPAPEVTAIAAVVVDEASGAVLFDKDAHLPLPPASLTKIATLILALAQAVDGWLAALIVTIVYAAIAGTLALLGKSRVEAGSPPVPERAVASSKEDVETAKRSAKEARS